MVPPKARTPTCPKPSEAIGSHRKPSEAIGSHRKPSEAIGSHQKPSKAIGTFESKIHQVAAHLRVDGEHGPEGSKEAGEARQHVHEAPEDGTEAVHGGRGRGRSAVNETGGEGTEVAEGRRNDVG